MGTQKLTRRAPTGAVVQLSWDGAEVGSEVAGVRFAGGSYGRGFQIHPLGAHDAAVAAFTPDAKAARLVVGRREVKISTAADGKNTTATLFGDHHELMTVFTGPAPSAARIVDLFGVLDIDDDPAGMRVRPQRRTLLSVVNEHHVLVAEDLVSLDVPGPAHAARLVPRHRGRRTRHGEVWKTPLPRATGAARARDFAYVVGTPTGAAQVIAADDAPATDAGLLRMVDSLDVSWSAGD